MYSGRIKHHKTGRIVSIGYNERTQFVERGDLFLALPQVPLLGIETEQCPETGPSGKYYSALQLRSWHSRLTREDYKSEAKNVADFIEWLEYAAGELKKIREQFFNPTHG